MTFQRRRSQCGFVLVGALVLALMVCVAASMAIHASQHRILEARSKEANLEARLVLDSAASRILSQLDRVFESRGAYGRDDLRAWLRGQSPSVSSPYSVTLASLDDVVPEDKVVSARVLETGGFRKSTMDPLYPDLWMSQTNFSVMLTARGQKAGYSDFCARYDFRIRAVPVTEWTVFNPGRQRDQVSLTRDSSDTGHAELHTYIGIPYSGSFSSTEPALINDASTSPPNYRLWRHVSDGQGVAKFPNAATMGALTFKGEYPDYEPDWSTYELWGSLRDPADMAVSSEVAARYIDFLQTQDWSLDWVSPGYQPSSISPNNPLFDPNPQCAGDHVAVLNLGEYLADRPGHTLYAIAIPYFNALPIPTIVVTNAEWLGASGAPVNLTFPPSVRVFFASDVNTNLCKLKVEGNIGFIPKNVDVLAISNFVPRILAPAIFATNELRLVTRTDITLDATNECFMEHQQYALLHRQLYQWASNIQAKVLSDPISPLYLPTAAEENYFLDFMVLSNLNNTVKPQISILTDAATNRIENIFTNILSRYNYAGLYEQSVCGLLNQDQMTALDGTLVDEHLPGTLSTIPGSFALSSLEVLTNRTELSQPFTSESIRYYHSLLPELENQFAIEARLVQWSPTNIPVPFALLTEANIQSVPFAKAYISIHTNYFEEYQEHVDLFQPTLQRVLIGTNGPVLTAVRPEESHPWGGSWRDYLWLNWSNGITTAPYLGMAIRAGLTANSQRYDSSGNWNAENVGAWKATTLSVFRESEETTPSDNRSDADLQAMDPALYNSTFVQRTIQFNYRTLGWTKTNSPTLPGPAPIFNGRLVVEDGIKRPDGLLPTGLVINGQLTYSHRLKWLASSSPFIHQFQVNRNPNTMPLGPDRLYDIRIAHVELNRL
jgi:hypothetical protein